MFTIYLSIYELHDLTDKGFIVHTANSYFRFFLAEVLITFLILFKQKHPAMCLTRMMPDGNYTAISPQLSVT